MKIIIATDGTETAITAARRALRLVHPDAHVELVTMVAAREDLNQDASGFAGPVETPAEADEEWCAAVQEGQRALQRTVEALGIEVDDARVVSTDAPVGQALIALARDEQPDLLVLGSNERSWFDRLLHGATEEQLLHDAPCPLLIVGPGQQG